MITGFNTDIEHDGVVYHVQTEDKGLDSPIILSLVYAGGTILASKRSPYADLIAQGFSDEVLAERLKRQHRLICAAIHSGRINDLKKMSVRRQEAAIPEELVLAEVAQAAPEVEAPADPSAVEAFEIEYWPVSQEWTPPPPAPPAEEIEPAEESEPASEPLSAQDSVLEAESDLAEETPAEEIPSSEADVEEGLIITLLDDEEFYSGDTYTLRVLISNRFGVDEKPLANVAVSIKILGTTFRPLIYSVKTERDGVATVLTEIPQFTSGRAAVLVRTVAQDQTAELRRIIHPGKNEV